MKRWLAALALALLLAPAARAATLHGTVTHVTDGDTLWVRLDGGGAPRELRLLDLDAPERCQVWGPQATTALQARVLRQRVTVRTHGRDAYGRNLARVEHRGHDLGAWLVRGGHAWSTTFKGHPGPYAKLQAQARAAHRGLWAAPAPLEPRRFRQRFGACGSHG
jgi:micrococcal nuclease